MEKEAGYSVTNKKSGRRNNRRYRLRGLQLAAVSFAMMALADFSVHVIRSFEKSYIAEFIYIGVTFVSWIMMFAGTRMIAEYERNYRQAFFAALPALSAGMIWIVSALYEVQNGIGHHTFTSAGVMFMAYICFLCMLYAYTHILNGSAAIMEDHNKLNLQRKCVRVWKPCFVLIILALICIQGAPLFSELTKYIITGAATLVTLIAEMIMIRYILAVYEQMDGERVSVRMEDLITRFNSESVNAEPVVESVSEKPDEVATESISGDEGEPEGEDESEKAEESEGEDEREKAEESEEESISEEEEEPAEESTGEESDEISDEEIYGLTIKIDREIQEKKIKENEEKYNKASNEDYSDEKTEELVETTQPEDETDEADAMDEMDESEKEIISDPDDEKTDELLKENEE